MAYKQIQIEGVGWDAAAPSAPQQTQVNGGQPATASQVPDRQFWLSFDAPACDLVFERREAKILIALCEAKGKLTVEKMRQKILDSTVEDVNSSSRAVPHAMRAITDQLEALGAKYCEYQPLNPAQKVAPEPGKNRMGTWRVKVIGGTFVLERSTKWAKVTIEKVTGQECDYSPQSAPLRHAAAMVVRAMSQQRPNLHQLPNATVIGREQELCALRQRLRLTPQHEPLLLGLWGMTGIGKTAIATFLANQWHTRFPRCPTLFGSQRCAGPHAQRHRIAGQCDSRVAPGNATVYPR